MVDGPFSIRSIIETDELVYPGQTRVVTRYGDQLQGVPATSFGLTGADNEWTGDNEFTGIPLLSGGGIQFPATQVPSANANTLDDYEEGTWTPGITFGGGSTGITYSVRGGIYTKVGRVVFLDFAITLTSKGSSTGNTLVTGLPFTADASNSGTFHSGSYFNMSGLSGGPIGRVSTSATTILIRTHAATGISNLNDTNFTNTSSLNMSGFYFV